MVLSEERIAGILASIRERIEPELAKGKVADYIPALARVPRERFAMSVTFGDGRCVSVGESEEPFSIQSISKAFTFVMALGASGRRLYERVGVEPSGNPFNSLVQLEYESGKPRNPFINAGALVVTDTLVSLEGSPQRALEQILAFVRAAADTEEIDYDREVARSEMEHADRNLALAHLMKSFGNFENDVREVTRTYFRQCAIAMNTRQLSRTGLFLAFGGEDPVTGRRFASVSQAKRTNAVMLTCGHYDASGEFAYHVGLPAKSGVGGGILAIVPGVCSIAVWSPGLNRYGNSHAGTLALEWFTTETGLSIF